MLHPQYADKITVDSGFPGVTTVTDTWRRLIQSRGLNGVHGYVEIQANDCWLIVRIREKIDAVSVDSYHVIGPGSSIIERVSPIFVVDCKGTTVIGAGLSDIAAIKDATDPDPYIIARWSSVKPSEAEGFSVGYPGLLAGTDGTVASGTIAIGSYTVIRPVKTLREVTIYSDVELRCYIYRGPIDFATNGAYPHVGYLQILAKVPHVVKCGGFTSLYLENTSAAVVANVAADWRKGVA